MQAVLPHEEQTKAFLTRNCNLYQDIFGHDFNSCYVMQEGDTLNGEVLTHPVLVSPIQSACSKENQNDAATVAALAKAAIPAGKSIIGTIVTEGYGCVYVATEVMSEDDADAIYPDATSKAMTNVNVKPINYGRFDINFTSNDRSFLESLQANIGPFIQKMYPDTWEALAARAHITENVNGYVLVVEFEDPAFNQFVADFPCMLVHE